MPEPPNPSPHGAPPSGLWARAKAHILHPELSEDQVAWSFAIGLSIAFNPLLGLHTVMVLLFCALFRHLHRPLMLLAAFINNPWTLVPIATASAYTGHFLRGKGLALNLAAIHWQEITWRSFVSWEGFQAMTSMLAPILRSYLLGGTFLCVAALPAGYYLMRFTVRRLRRMHLHLPHCHPDHPSEGAPHGHAIPDAPGPADAGKTAGSPGQPAG